MTVQAPEIKRRRTSEFSVHSKGSAPQAARNLFAAAEEKFGFIPNVLRNLAESPIALTGLLQMLGTFEASSLTPVEQRIILLTVSLEHHANYCVAANSTVAQMQGVPADIIESLRTGAPLSDPKLEALRNFVIETVHERGWATEDAVRKLSRSGFTKAQIFDVIFGMALETMVNYTERVAGTPLNEQFHDNAWAPNSELVDELATELNHL